MITTLEKKKIVAGKIVENDFTDEIALFINYADGENDWDYFETVADAKKVLDWLKEVK